MIFYVVYRKIFTGTIVITLAIRYLYLIDCLLLKTTSDNTGLKKYEQYNVDNWIGFKFFFGKKQHWRSN